MNKQRSIVGDIINFRGLIYSPLNENGVIFLFGKVMEDLNMYIEEIKPGFPDCVGRRFTGKGWEKVNIEFEFRSSNFLEHGHEPELCDIVVCWEHDWGDCPLEVLELKEIIRSLPNKPITRPDKVIEEEGEYTLEDHFEKEKTRQMVKDWYNKLEAEVTGINEDIWIKPAKNIISFYSPERVFAWIKIRKTQINIELFTRAEKIPSVRSFGYSTGGFKWGKITLRKEADFEKVLEALKESYKKIKEAIRNNESTGWYAKLEEEIEEEEEEGG
jgi:predicted DNA-binding protein (MmcQ/YjbR family)